MIKTTFDPEADVFFVCFAAPDAVYDGSEEVSPGIVLDYDTEGRVTGIEVMYMALRLAGHVKGKDKSSE